MELLAGSGDARRGPTPALYSGGL